MCVRTCRLNRGSNGLGPEPDIRSDRQHPKIMTNGHAQRDTLSDDTAAKFATTLDIQCPRRITAAVLGSMILKDAAMTVSSTQWVLPGKSVPGGDRWVLELPGFAITLREPLPAAVELKGSEARIPLKTKITMHCGCPQSGLSKPRFRSCGIGDLYHAQIWRPADVHWF